MPADWLDEATPSSAAARRSGLVRSDDAEKLLPHSPHLTQTSLPAYPFTSMGRYALPFPLLVSPPSLPADPFTSVASFHDVYSRTRIT